MSDEPVVRRSDERFLTMRDGIVSRYLLSFGAHYDPQHVALGPLTAYNDETLESGAGFSEHRHRDVEIVTWVVRGRLRHDDSTGRSGVARPNMVQRLSAGSGVMHSEVNADANGEPVHFIQMWLRPASRGEDPSYEDEAIDPARLAAGFVVVATGDPALKGQAAVTVDQPMATLYASRLAAGIERELPTSGWVHVFVVSGELSVVGLELREGDSALFDLEPPDSITLTAAEASEVLVWGLAHPGEVRPD